MGGGVALKLLYCSDTHIRGTSPQGRKDDFTQTMLQKLREVIALARDHGVAAILHGGDLFDRPDVAPAVALQFLNVLKEAPCPIYAIAGNHDMYGFNPQTVSRGMLGLYDGFGVVHLLRPGEVAWIVADALRVQVTGQEFHVGIDRRDPHLDYCVAAACGDQTGHWRRPDADYAIHLTHGMLLERPFFEGSAFSLLESIMERTAADITFGAHYHPGWSRVYESGDRLFINPGALARLGSQRADVERPVQVVLLELEAGRPIAPTFVPLAAAAPASAVFDLRRGDAQMGRERALADFILGIGDVSRLEALEVQTIMERIAESADIEAPVRTEALRRLGLAQEHLDRSGVDAP